MPIRIDARRITDRGSFHDVFAETFGFFSGYGRNMDAWIDCLSSLDDSEDGRVAVHVPPGTTLTLAIDHARAFKAASPELYMDLVECTAFVNWRRSEAGEPALIALAFDA